MSTKRGEFMFNYRLKLKEVREAKGLKQSELAEKLNTSQQVVSKYELNKIEPSVERLVELAQILDVSLDELIEFKKIHSEYSKKLNITTKKTHNNT